jgi:hypothetical protein
LDKSVAKREEPSGVHGKTSSYFDKEGTRPTGTGTTDDRKSSRRVGKQSGAGPKTTHPPNRASHVDVQGIRRANRQDVVDHFRDLVRTRRCDLRYEGWRKEVLSVQNKSVVSESSRGRRREHGGVVKATAAQTREQATQRRVAHISHWSEHKGRRKNRGVEGTKRHRRQLSRIRCCRQLIAMVGFLEVIME